MEASISQSTQHETMISTKPGVPSIRITFVITKEHRQISIPNKQERKLTAFICATKQVPSKYHVRGRSDTTGSKAKQLLSVEQPRSKARKVSKSQARTIDRDAILSDKRFTDAAQKLSNEELAALYEDIVKPLDVCSILHERREYQANARN